MASDVPINEVNQSFGLSDDVMDETSKTLSAMPTFYLAWVLGSSHIHVNVLGHNVESCHLSLFPVEFHYLQILPDYSSPVCPLPTRSLLKPGTSQCSVCCGMR